MKKIENPKEFVKECDSFKDYKDINEYIEDVVACLVYSPWGYSEKRAREIVKDRKKYIKEAFENEEAANDCSAEVGYFCG